jgi:DNA-binding response OmpR family regulator
MKKIIVLEDEQVLQKALSIELLGAGFEVLSALDGEAGLALVKKELPDLVLLDLTMPKMNGFDVLKNLKEDATTKSIPVIILSNLGQDEDKEKGLSLGATDYYVKSSTDLSLLTEKIKKVIG